MTIKFVTWICHMGIHHLVSKDSLCFAKHDNFIFLHKKNKSSIKCLLKITIKL